MGEEFTEADLDESLENALEEGITKEEREAIDAKSSVHMKSTTHTEKLYAQGIRPFSGWRNIDVLFLVCGFFLGCLSMHLLHYAHYKTMCITCLLSALCFPLLLLSPRGDLAKTLEYFTVELVKAVAGRWIERKIGEKQNSEEEGVLLSIHRRLTR